MEIKDLAGLSQPLTKLLEVIEKGVGAISRPYLIRKTADAKAYELRVITEAQSMSRGLLAQGEYVDGHITVRSIENPQAPPSLPERAETRARFKQLNAQTNVEAVCAEAAEELSGENVVAETELEPDWITRFFKLAEEVSSEEMQQLWGRILAGEVRTPGSVSLRTLDALRNMSRTEAELFCRLGKLAIDPNGSGEPIVINPDKFLADIYGLDFKDILVLRELGLIHQEFSLSWQFEAKAAGRNWFEHAGNAIVMQWDSPIPKFGIPVMIFTKTGRELLPLVPKTFDKAYVEKFCTLMKRPTCKFSYGPITERIQGGVKIGEIFPLIDETTEQPSEPATE